MTVEASSDEVVFATRPMRPSDEGLVYSSFLGIMRDSDASERIPSTLFYEIFKQEWSAVLAHFTVLVAHPEGDDNEIAGYLAFKRNTVAFLYVKHHPWGRLGVARRLLAEAGFRKEEPVFAIYGSSRAFARARAKGWIVKMVPHTQAIRLLLGVA